MNNKLETKVCDCGVEGMHCQNCAKKIRQELETLQGVEKVYIEWENKLVSVTHTHGEADVRNIVDRIESIDNGKFTVSSVTYRTAKGGPL